MSASEPPPEFVSLWPISRGPLRSGRIVRLEDGGLAEWYPLPDGWPTPSTCGAEHGSGVPFDSGSAIPIPRGRRDVLKFQAASESGPGWLLLPRSDDPTLDQLLAGAVNPVQKAGLLKGLAALIRSRIDQDSVFLHPALIYAPGAGLSQNDITDLETWNYPSAKSMMEVWEEFLSDGVGSPGENWTNLLDRGICLQLADFLVAKNDPEAAACFLEFSARGIADVEKKRQKDQWIFWGLAGMVICLILGLALAGRFAREQYQGRVRAQFEIRQNETLRSGQIRALVQSGRRMREALPNSGLVPRSQGQMVIQLSGEERKEWRDWLALASTFETQDNSEPELMLARAEAHLLLGQNDQARQLCMRVASGSGPRAALACLALADGFIGADGEKTVSAEDRKGWLDQADKVLNSDDDSPFADLVRAYTGFSQERFCLENNAHSEAQKLRSESLDLVWELVETRTRERHSELAPHALILLLEHLGPGERKLAKVGNHIEETLAKNTGFFDLYRVKNSRLALLGRDAVNHAEVLALGLAHHQSVVTMAGRFPNRLELRTGEVLDALDLADEFSLMVADSPSQNGSEEVWIWANEQAQSLLNRTPREPNHLRLMGRCWITGARVADAVPGGEGVSLNRLEKGLGIWNLLERIQGPKEEIRLARARTLAEMSALGERLGHSKQAETLETASQTILATLLQENPGAIVALETHIRSGIFQAMFKILKKDWKAAKKIVDGLVGRLASFPPSRDPVDQKQIQLLLIQARLFQLNLAIRESPPKDHALRIREMASIRDVVAKITQDSETREEIGRIRARLSLLEWSLASFSKGKSDSPNLELSKIQNSKPESKNPMVNDGLLEKTAREAVARAVWEPWEGRNLFSIWRINP